MLRVWSDVLTVADICEITLLGLIHLSAAFNRVNYAIVLHC